MKRKNLRALRREIDRLESAARLDQGHARRLRRQVLSLERAVRSGSPASIHVAVDRFAALVIEIGGLDAERH